jgi:GT2 family glycosyltransferase
MKMSKLKRSWRSQLLAKLISLYRRLPLPLVWRLWLKQCFFRLMHFVPKQNVILPVVKSDFSFPSHDNPVISIIVPVYGKCDYTLRCLYSVFLSPPNVPYEVIVADDVSPDDTVNRLQKIRGLRLLVNQVNLGFIGNCNNAAREAKGEYVIFLNNDTHVFSQWCDVLLQCFTKDSRVGLVGSKLIFPDGSLQEAGGIIWNDASAWNYGRLEDPTKPEYNYLKEVDYCSGASLIIKKTLFQQLGGFDSYYAPAYCEDSDLAFKVRQAGYKVVYQPLSVVIHFEGITQGTDVTTGLKKYQAINQHKFFARWQTILQQEHYPRNHSEFLARDRSQHRPCLLIIDYTIPQFDRDAGSRTLDTYLQILVAAGFNIKLLPRNGYIDETYTVRYQQMGIEVFYGDICFKYKFKRWLLKNGEFIDYVLLSRPTVAADLTKLIRNYTSAKILFYGHDIHYLRLQAEYALKQQKLLKKQSHEMQMLEQQVWQNVDVIYYPSQYECDSIKKIITDKTVRYLPAYCYDINYSQGVADFSQRKDLMFVANFKHTPNIDGIQWFLQEIFPLVLQVITDVKVFIVGADPPKGLLNFASERVCFTDYLSDQALNDYYANCRLAIAPLRFGAGVKGKVVDALARGIPVVTTSFGAQGIPAAEQAMLIADDSATMSAAIVQLYQDEILWKRFAENARQIIAQHFSRQAIIDTLRLDIPELIGKDDG